MSTALVQRESYEVAEYGAADLIAQVTKIQQVMKAVMHEGEHYGVIPGTGTKGKAKPSLLKPGAEKLGFTFRLAPKFFGEDNPRDLGKGHREYIIKCELYHVTSGRFMGSGLGSCSTMEGKYRYRTGPKESTGKPVPREYWDSRNSDPEKALNLIGGKGFSVSKNESGVWEIVRAGEKVENDNPADHYNTVLKMAKKRAHVDAVLTATAASDIFTQDVEDLVENGVIVPPQETPKQAERPKPVERHTEQADVHLDGPPDPDIAWESLPTWDSLPTKNPEAPKQATFVPPTDPKVVADTISGPQAKRLWAICMGKGMTKEHAKAITVAMGYEHSADILKRDYRQLCEAAESWTPDAHDRIVAVLKGYAEDVRKTPF